jgi:hypothetical protein
MLCSRDEVIFPDTASCVPKKLTQVRRTRGANSSGASCHIIENRELNNFIKLL